MRAWIGVDLDGTLAEYDGWRGPEHIGDPVPVMVERVKRWLEDGQYAVKIMTARISNVGAGTKLVEVIIMIQDWLEDAGLPRLEVTCTKDFGMVELWDDRCVQVIQNTGEPVGESTRGLK